MTKKIVILSGGPGLERQVAIKSAQFIKDHINEEFDYYELPEQFDDFLKNKDLYKLAIPVFHGEYGEDGKIFAFLDTLGIPTVGSNYYTHAVCLNKKDSNTLAQKGGLHIPKEYFAQNELDFPENYPVIMKPNRGGSSFHTYKIHNNEEFSKYYKATRVDLDDDIMIQEYILGDEYSISMVGKEVLPIMMLEKQDKNDFFDYEAKYESESGIKEVFPEIEHTLKEKLVSTALKAQEIFNVKGYFRIDVLVRDGEVYFLEVNTIPGTTGASILPKAWRLTGRSNEELVKTIIKS